MKKIWENKVYLVICASIVLFLIVSVLSFTSIGQLQGNARVVNYDGIVRGATQKLMKMEIQNAHSGNVDEAARDALRARLDRILYALDTGRGEDSETEKLSNIIALPDEVHSTKIKALLEQWDALKNEIDNVRLSKEAGEPDSSKLFALSEDYFKLANDTVFAAEDYSERQVSNTKNTLIVVDVVFVLLILVALAYIIRSMAVKRRADMLGTIAYIDTLTQLENRASCERLINELKATPPEYSVAVIMFDMNNLKLVNDFIGHQGGDKIIKQFALILKESAAKYGFIGRYGGDEFLGIFKKTDESSVQSFISDMLENTAAYNSLQINDIEKISFAVGYTVKSLKETSIDDMIYEADRNMYTNKREIKARV